MYKLYFNKKDKEMLISPIVNQDSMLSLAGDEPVWYNDCYFVCNNRKKLREKSIKIRNKWISELEDELEGIMTLKVKNRY